MFREAARLKVLFSFENLPIEANSFFLQINLFQKVRWKTSRNSSAQNRITTCKPHPWIRILTSFVAKFQTTFSSAFLKKNKLIDWKEVYL